MKKSIFSLLEKYNIEAYHAAIEMEKLIFNHPDSAVVKAGVFIESIIQDIFKKENIKQNQFKVLSDRIYYLKREGYVDKKIYESLNYIRRGRNIGAHNSAKVYLSRAIRCHEEMYNIFIWYYETYCNYDGTVPNYESPSFKDKAFNVFAKDLKSEIVKSIMEAVDYTKSNNAEQSLNIDIDKKRDKPTSTKSEKNLLEVLNKLKESSQEAIENPNNFSDFKNYLHVERQVQKDLENLLIKNKGNSKNLIFLCGNVGDGKSHILAYLNSEKKHLIDDYYIINDATESKSPTMDAMETLAEKLKAFSDQLIDTSNEKIILAINLGVLHNFINYKHKKYTYEKLKSFIERSNIFSSNVKPTYSEPDFDLISFAEYQYFELTERGPQSTFYESLLKKVTDKSPKNPFYQAYSNDVQNGNANIIHKNYEILLNEVTQQKIINLMIKVIVKYKLVISARAFLNFIADIIIPVNYYSQKKYTTEEELQALLPNILYESPERSFILEKVCSFDPINFRVEELDKIYIELNIAEFDNVLEKFYLPPKVKELFKNYSNRYNKEDSAFQLFSKTLIRTLAVSDGTYSQIFWDRTINDYLSFVYAFKVGDQEKIEKMYEIVNRSIYLWQGHINQQYIFYENTNVNYRLAQKLNLKPDVKHIKPKDEKIIQSFIPTLIISYSVKDLTVKSLEVDYSLYSLLENIINGYIPKPNDAKDAIMFTEFIKDLMPEGEKMTKVILHFSKENKNYFLKRTMFGGYSFGRII